MGSNINTPYDDVFRTLLNDCPKLIIPVVNNTFGTDYTQDDEVILYNNEFFITAQDVRQDEVITDSHFKIRDEKYHFECQSTSDNTMVMRMFQYDVQIAMRDGELFEDIYRIRFPKSAILYLRSSRNTPDAVKIEIAVPGDSCSYSVPAVKMKSYSVEDIFEKKLLFLIPFYIFVYEAGFPEYEKNESALKRLKDIFSGIIEKLDKLSQDKVLSEYYKQTIIDMSKKVISSIAAKYQLIEKGLGDVMGGKILDYEAKDILNQGIEQGIEQGMKQGIEQGKAEGKAEGKTQVFINMIKRGFSVKDAQGLAELSDEQVQQVLSSMKK